MEPKVTVIIATFNRAGSLPNAIDSVLSQTFKDFELLVIDNGSTDNTRAVVEGYRDERVNYALNEKPTSSCASPRNVGINIAKNEYVAFLDDDDIWYPEKLEICVAGLNKHPEAALVCHAQNVVLSGRFLRKNICGPWSKDLHERLLYEGNCLGPGSVVIRKKDILKIEGFDTRYEYIGCDDYDLWIRLAARGAVFYFIDDALSEFRITGLNYSLIDPYHCVRVAEMVRDNIIKYEGKNAISVKGRGRMGVLYFQAARTLHKSGKHDDAMRYYGKFLRCGYVGLKKAIREVLARKVLSWRESN